MVFPFACGMERATGYMEDGEMTKMKCLWPELLVEEYGRSWNFR